MILRANELGRWYGQVVGLNELTVDVEGGMTGLVGPNGAGKSTFLKLIAGELRPSRGSVEVLGEAPFANRKLYRRLGFCPQQDAFWRAMSGIEMVTLLLRLAGYSTREAVSRADAAIDRVGMTKRKKHRLGTYSKGMRQRIKLAQSIAHDPELLVLDEPLTGLDPMGRREILSLLEELVAGGMHVILSSHVLHEIEKVTPEILLLHRGRLLAKGTVADVRELLSRHPRRVELRAQHARELARELVGFEEVLSVDLARGDGLVSLQTRDVGRFYELLTTSAAQGEFGITHMESVDASLEAVFDYLVV